MCACVRARMRMCMRGSGRGESEREREGVELTLDRPGRSLSARMWRKGGGGSSHGRPASAA